MTGGAVVFTADGLRRGGLGMLPVALGLSVFGMAYGLVAGQKGLSVLETGLMSAIVFAGASQMLALELWVEPVPVGTLAFAALVINLRYMLMTPALAPWFVHVGPAKAYGSLFFTADESWALSVAELRRGGRDAAYHLGAGLMLYAVWLASSIIGRVVGTAVADPAAWGLDFIATAVFIALLVPMWRGRRDALPWVVAGVVAVLAERLLPGTWYLVAGGLAGSVVGAWTSGGRRYGGR